MLRFLRKVMGDRNPLRLFWHRVWGVIAAVRYGFPARSLRVVLVTGTKGKTTTAWTVGSLLQECGVKTAVATTALFRRGGEVWVNETKMTTLGRMELQRFLRKAVREGCEVAVVEASSQAEVQSRLWGVRAEGVIWTNLQEDHLEYHGGWENYREAKGRILDKVKEGGVVVLNGEDEEVEWFLARAKKRGARVKLVGRGVKKKKGVEGYVVGDVGVSEKGLSFNLGGVGEFESSFTGKFNAINLAEAVVMVMSLGVEREKIKRVLREEVRPVPGRLEEVKNERGYTILIDFAYTPKALENALEATKARRGKGGKLWVVFGAVAGGRDKRKRGMMGKVAEEGADRIVLTDDDLGEEDDSAEVIRGVVGGFSEEFRKKEGEIWWRVTPREKAVGFVLESAREGDCVLLAGKGCEMVQHYGARQRKYNEREVVEGFLVRGEGKLASGGGG